MRATITIDVENKSEFLFVVEALAGIDVKAKTVSGAAEATDDAPAPVNGRKYHQDFYAVYGPRELEEILRKQGKLYPSGTTTEEMREACIAIIPPPLHLATLTTKKLREELRRRKIKPNKANTKSEMIKRIVSVVSGEEKR